MRDEQGQESFTGAEVAVLIQKALVEERERCARAVEAAGEEWSHRQPLIERIFGPAIRDIYYDAAAVVRGTDDSLYFVNLREERERNG